MVARWSRDEFRIGLLELKDRDDGMMVAGRLLEKLKIPMEVEGRQICAQASVGVSLYPLLDASGDPPMLRFGATLKATGRRLCSRAPAAVKRGRLFIG